MSPARTWATAWHLERRQAVDLPWRRMVDELVAALSCRVWTRRPTRRHSVFGAEWGDERGRDEHRTGGTADWRSRYRRAQRAGR
jgi:hypothetical protein